MLSALVLSAVEGAKHLLALEDQDPLLGDPGCRVTIDKGTMESIDNATMTTQTVVGELFAFWAQEHHLERIGGGSETDVYRTADARHVIKLKDVTGESVAAALRQVTALRNTARHFANYLGAEHTIPTNFLLAHDQAGNLTIVAIQPYLSTALPLAAVDYHTLPPRQWAQIERQLLTVLRRALRCYKRTGHMPDLYGVFSRTVAERRRLNTPLLWPVRVWRFFTQRLWRAHNLLLTHEPQSRVVLVDYDHVRWPGLWGRLYYAICWLLFWRELLLLAGWEATSLIEEEVRSAEAVTR